MISQTQMVLVVGADKADAVAIMAQRMGFRVLVVASAPIEAAVKIAANWEPIVVREPLAQDACLPEIRERRPRCYWEPYFRPKRKR